MNEPELSGVHPAPNIQAHPEIYEIENRAADTQFVIERAIHELFPWEGRSVCDLGTGTGFHAVRFAVLASEVVAVEPDPVLLGLAEKRFQATRLNVRGLRGSAESLPLPERSIDLVHARFAYFWGPGCEPGLRELRRVIRPGGMAVIIDNDPGWGQFAGWLSRSAWYRSRDFEAANRFWSAQGFESTQLQSSWRFSSAADLEAVLRIEFPPELVPELLAEVEELSISYGYVLRHRRY